MPKRIRVIDMRRRTRRKCPECGAEFYGSSDSVFCPECVKGQRKDTVRKRICIICGCSFDGGPRAKRCPECREQAKKETSVEFKKTGPDRSLGSIDYCQWCGKEYAVRAGRQKYCSDACSRAAILEWQRKHKKLENKEKLKERRRETKAKRQKVCVYCKKTFWSEKNTNLCSDYCREKQLQIKQCESDLRRGRKRDMQKYLNEREEYRKNIDRLI